MAVVDRGDFAGCTSQESSNLVWGGFKYLENYEIGLVRELCRSRNRLTRAYPANISTIGFLAALDDLGPVDLHGYGQASFASAGKWDGLDEFHIQEYDFELDSISLIGDPIVVDR